MLRPIIMIGCGGAGNKVVRYTRDAVERRLKEAGWDQGVPRAWQFIGIDSLPFQEDFSVPFLPNNDYFNISLGSLSYLNLHNGLDAKFGLDGKNPSAFRNLLGWRPNPNQIANPPWGLPNSRSSERVKFLANGQNMVRDRIRYAFNQCAIGGIELSEASRNLGMPVLPNSLAPAPLVFVVGSMAGSTGSAILLDVVDLVRRCDGNGAYPSLIALTQDVFGLSQWTSMTANSAAFISELLSSYWSERVLDTDLIHSDVQVFTQGPHSTFFVGRRNIDGLDLASSKNVCRAVGGVLSAVVTSAHMQENFSNFHLFRRPMVAANNQGGYGFANQYLPGVASSFGSATISIGRNRQREYVKHLIHRSIIEHLVDGFESVAAVTLGETFSKSMTGQAKISELARRNVAKFVMDCGLQEEVSGTRQVTQNFVSAENRRYRMNSIVEEIRKSLKSTQQAPAAVWRQIIFAKATEIQSLTRRGVDEELSGQLRNWGTDLLRQVLKSTNEHSAKLSMPVVISMLELTRTQVLESAQLLRFEAREARGYSAAFSNDALAYLSGKRKGNVEIHNSDVNSTISDISEAIAHEWSALVREKLAITLESASYSLLSGVDAALRASLARLNALATSQDGAAPVIAEWPRNDDVVPAFYAPSPVEFYLEDYTTWPASTTEMLRQSLGEGEVLPLDPVEAARTLIIRGGFNASENDAAVPPLIWTDGYEGSPVWEPGLNVFVKVQDDIESLGNRIDSWLRRPDTKISNVLNENLGDYLQTKNPRSGVAITNHQERLSRFRQLLQLALVQSRPLVEIDAAMNATVHPHPLSYVLSIQGFPFGLGHPARKDTEEIIQGFLSTAESVDWAFTSSETESVLLTSFLEYPVNPSVVTSFTQPLNSSLNQTHPFLLKSSFWQWRRARVLDNFVPLPDELRIAAIRGFAVARALGLMTAFEEIQNVISTSDGIYKFPKHLLTVHNKNNLLPALLESMILAFADAVTMGRNAFDAYGNLIDYGLSNGGASGFMVDRDFERILRTGDYGRIKIVDQDKANVLLACGSRFERAEKIIEYLQRNIERFEDLERSGLDPQSWRNSDGTVMPIDTLTHELLPDLRNAYEQVLDAVRKWMRPEIKV